jgi:hypothetical protein
LAINELKNAIQTGRLKWLCALELEVILLKVVAVGTSTLSKLFTIDVTSNIILIMVIYLKSHQSCLQILKFSGRGGDPLMLPPLGLCPSVGKIFYIY